MNILTVVDPNDNAKRRFQYAVAGGWLLLRRVLPGAGNVWRDEPMEPWWEPVLELPTWSRVHDFWVKQSGGSLSDSQYSWSAKDAAAHVVAYTPNGREVRSIAGGGCELQAPNDNYWVRHPDLDAARRWYADALRADASDAAAERHDGGMAPG